MFGTVIEKVQALLSRSFLLGSFFPVLVFSILNFLVAYLGIDGFQSSVTEMLSRDSTSTTTIFVVGFVGITIVAFILTPLIPVFRSILEGAIILPQKTRDRLIGHHVRIFKGLQDDLKKTGECWSDLRRRQSQAGDLLGDARNASSHPRNCDDMSMCDRAEKAFKALQEAIMERSGKEASKEKLPPIETVDIAMDAIRIALEHYPMKTETPGYDLHVFNKVDHMQLNFLFTLDELVETAYQAMQEADAKCRLRFVTDAIKATPLANSRAALEHYSHVAYGVDFHFIWPRLRLVIEKDKNVFSAVETAAAQLDFAVLMTTLCTVSTLTWVVALIFFGKAVLTFLLMAILGPALVVLFYQLVNATQQAFGAVTVMAIDGLRFELLQALHLPLPSSLAKEQAAWSELQKALYSAPENKVLYRHTKQ
ncbi:hypothetical protein SAMN04487926_11616 [Paraburkholderia steynii]|uniref:Uncharacterized protein n=1 Tax=Paraburkholderia steynii TaxID=1245441 RepID=A0A7Z7BAK5_9BURK|nr:hypothetical protein [Paraburkholderia steynii]SDI38613.1 hypothetical protein SAMN04487926_11616 [Paraburkholderia steynii]